MTDDLELRKRIGEALGWRVEKSPERVRRHADIQLVWTLYTSTDYQWGFGATAESAWGRAPAWESSRDAAFAGNGPGEWLAERGYKVIIDIHPDGTVFIVAQKVTPSRGILIHDAHGQRGQEAHLLCELFLRVKEAE